MRYQIRWPRVIVLAVASGLALLAVRGCVMARSAQGQTTKTAQEDAPDVTLPVGVKQDVRISVFLKDAAEKTQMPLETYIVGVVAAEMPASFDAEALKAQAVAARTYTIYKSTHSGCRSADADVCTGSACCQAYASDGTLRTRWGEQYADNLQKITDAVHATSSEVLLYDGAPIEALYHSASGGRTEDSEAVYAVAVPYLRSVESTNETGSSHLTGDASFSRREFARRVNETWPTAALTADALDKQVEILRATQSGRVQEMRLGGTIVSGKQVRALFGLDSTLFQLILTRSSVCFETRGFGHGVGMSQTGANSMGKGGRTYVEILQHYYQGVSIGKIDSREADAADHN